MHYRICDGSHPSHAPCLDKILENHGSTCRIPWSWQNPLSWQHFVTKLFWILFFHEYLEKCMRFQWFLYPKICCNFMCQVKGKACIREWLKFRILTAEESTDCIIVSRLLRHAINVWCVTLNLNSCFISFAILRAEILLYVRSHYESINRKQTKF